MAKRKSIGASLRWHVFARDGFTCRYCGMMAGHDGVELAVDHVVSVADGGSNNPDNLVTACRKCNGGKGARSLGEAPTPRQVVKRIRKGAANLLQQAKAVQEAIAAEKALRQEVVNLKCAAYGIERCTIKPGEVAAIRRLIGEFGADQVLVWYQSAATHNCKEWDAVRYVCGCARNQRGQANA